MSDLTQVPAAELARLRRTADRYEHAADLVGRIRNSATTRGAFEYEVRDGC